MYLYVQIRQGWSLGMGAQAKIALALQILDGKSQTKLQVAHSMSGYDPGVVS